MVIPTRYKTGEVITFYLEVIYPEANACEGMGCYLVLPYCWSNDFQTCKKREDQYCKTVL